MNKRKQLRIENNKKIQLRVEFRNKFKYIVKKFISQNIFKETGMHEELKIFGITIATTGKDLVDWDSNKFLFVTETKVNVFIKIGTMMYEFYLDKSFNICINEFTTQYLYNNYFSNENFKAVKHIEEIYEKIKLNEELEQELNKIELQTIQRKRVKI